MTKALALFVALAFLCAVTAGCKKADQPSTAPEAEKADDPPPQSQPGEPKAPEAGASAAECLELWKAGKLDEAREKFLTVNWAGAAAQAKPSILQLTEADYIKAGSAEKAKYDAEIQVINKVTRDLARAVMAAAKSKKAADAAKDYHAVVGFSDWVSGDDAGLLIVKLVAKAIKGSAQTELDTVYTTLDYQAKLEAVRKGLSQPQMNHPE